MITQATKTRKKRRTAIKIEFDRKYSFGENTFVEFTKVKAKYGNNDAIRAVYFEDSTFSQIVDIREFHGNPEKYHRQDIDTFSGILIKFDSN